MLTQSAEILRKYTDNETFEKIVDYGTVPEMWKNVLANFGENTAIMDEGTAYTYRQLEEDASYIRGLLYEEGIEKKSLIGIYAPNSYDFVKAYIAVVTSGFGAVILPPQLDEKTVYGCTLKFGLKGLLYHPAFEEKVGLTKKLSPDLFTALTSEKGANAAPADENTGEEDPCVVMFTGGTTGKSKGALLPHRAVLQGTVNGCYGYHDVFCQRYLLVLPLSHVFGLIRNLMTSLYTGSTLYICRNNKDMFRDIAVFKPTILVMVPALLEMCLNLSGKFGKNMLGPDMKYIICGAAIVPPYLIAEYRKFGITVFPGYGLTESANLVSGNPECVEKPDSVGLPYPNQEFRIENGELWLKGRNMMTSYIGEDNEAAYEDGWFKTGDLVRLDEEGFLYITGRIKEIIVLPTGENISPAEVEQKFNELACIQDCQVFEDVTESGSHILALEAVPRMTELTGVAPENIGAYVTEKLNEVNASLPSYQRVSRIVIRDTDFERTPSMKIVRYKKCN